MIEDIYARLVARIYAPFSPGDRFFVGYLAVAVLRGALVLRRDPHSGQRRSAAQLAACLLPRRVFLHASALLDYRFVLVNYYVVALLASAMFLSATTTSGWMLGALNIALGPNRHAAAPGLISGLVFTAVVFVVIDFGNFLGHWLQHKVPALWEFHKIHHSAEVLTPITALRVHPVSEILSTQIIALCVGVANGGFLYLYQGPLAETTLLGVNALDFLYFTIGAYHLAHSHVWLMFPRGLREIFYSPALHLIHHSVDPRHRDKNFAFALTIWDRVAGTLYMPQDSEKDTLVLGLDGDEQRDFQSVRQLYATPFRNLLARYAGRKPAAEAPIDGVPAE